jgi:hypothetical protein
MIMRRRSRRRWRSSSTRQEQRDNNRGKCPALSTRCGHFSKRLSDEEDKMTVELRDTDDAEPLTDDGEDTECISCTSLFSEDHHGEN